MKIKDILCENEENNKPSNLGSYVGVMIDQRSQERIENFCQDFGIECIDEIQIPLIVTEEFVFASREKSDIIFEPIVFSNFEIRKGRTEEDQTMIYASFDSPELVETRNEIIKNNEIEDDVYDENWFPYFVIGYIEKDKELNFENLSIEFNEYVENVFTEELFKEPLDKEYVNQYKKKENDNRKQSQKRNKSSSKENSSNTKKQTKKKT